MYFRNESGHEPYPLHLPDCEQRCPLLKFLQLTDPVIAQDWEQECQVASTMKDTGEWQCSDQATRKEPVCFVCPIQSAYLFHFVELIVGLAVCGSILFLLTVLLLTVLFRMKAQPPGYRHVSNEGEEQPWQLLQPLLRQQEGTLQPPGTRWASFDDWTFHFFVLIVASKPKGPARLDVRATMMIKIIWIMHWSTGCGIPAWSEVAVC